MSDMGGNNLSDIRLPKVKYAKILNVRKSLCNIFLKSCCTTNKYCDDRQGGDCVNKIKTLIVLLMALVRAEWAKFKAWYLNAYVPKVSVFINNRYGMPGKGGDGKGTTGKIGDWIGLTVSLIFGVYLLPVIIDTIVTTNYTNWTFTGASGAKVLYQLLPFIFIVGMIVYFIGRLLGKI